MVLAAKLRPNLAFASALFLCLFFICAGAAHGAEVLPRPQMPSNWVVQSDFQVPVEQVKRIGMKLGAELSGVRNTMYSVGGKRVQINLIVAKDHDSAANLMKALRTIKAEVALLQKGRIVYEFVGQNDVLPLIAQGREHLNTL